MPSPACRLLAACLLFASSWGMSSDPAAGAREAGQSRRVVDIVQAGHATSERDHDYEGDGATSGVAGGRTFRQASGWLRYAMRVYDDADVTVACTFRGTSGRKARFELVVEERAIATHTLASPADDPVTKEFRVPAALTLGKTMITVLVRAVDGPTPALVELRTIQEHLE